MYSIGILFQSNPSTLVPQRDIQYSVGSHLTVAVFTSMPMGQAQLAIVCRPNARESAIVGWVGNRLALRLAAPAREGMANEAAVELVASAAGIAPSTVEITHGAGGRLKLLTLPLAGLEQLQATIPGYGS